jgi:hypothetical protein
MAGFLDRIVSMARGEAATAAPLTRPLFASGERSDDFETATELERAERSPATPPRTERAPGSAWSPAPNPAPNPAPSFAPPSSAEVEAIAPAAQAGRPPSIEVAAPRPVEAPLPAPLLPPERPSPAPPVARWVDPPQTPADGPRVAREALPELRPASPAPPGRAAEETLLIEGSGAESPVSPAPSEPRRAIPRERRERRERPIVQAHRPGAPAAFSASPAITELARGKAAEEGPDIHIHIGRIDVRAVGAIGAAGPARPAPENARKPSLTLEKYLEERNRGPR